MKQIYAYSTPHKESPYKYGVRPYRHMQNIFDYQIVTNPKHRECLSGNFIKSGIKCRFRVVAHPFCYSSIVNFVSKSVLRISWASFIL